MLEIRDKVYSFSKDHKPCAHAKPGDLIEFNTLDCFSGKLSDESVTMKDMDFSYNITNPAAGPVYVEGAMPGDILEVSVLSIDLDSEGTIATDDHCGPLYENTDYKTKKVPIKDGKAYFNDISFPIKPMIGVMGIAPKEGDIACGFVGDHGGNMDNKLIGAHSRVYFPVQVEGALLQMGDVHAAMGDAELCGTGIETGAKILVKISLIKGQELHWPVLETEDKWYVNASAQEFDESLMNASKEMQRLLMKATGWSAVDTYMYMSVQCDVELNQACKPCEVQLSLRIGAPKHPQIKPLISRP